MLKIITVSVYESIPVYQINFWISFTIDPTFGPQSPIINNHSTHTLH